MAHRLQTVGFALFLVAIVIAFINKDFALAALILIASFSRALLEGLSDVQSDEEFNSVLDATVEGVYRASIVGWEG